MRLDFNVLWVDDQPDRVESLISAIKRRMEREGFNFCATLCRTPDDVASNVQSEVFNDEVDLILVDWDLGAGGKGEEVIEEIRRHIQFKDVVFYTAQNDAHFLRDAAHKKGLEGVFCASRDELVDEVLGVFESLVKKVLDLDHTRGIVMGATSDIDFIVRECLQAAHWRLTDKEKRNLAQDSLDLIVERLESLNGQLSELQRDPDFLLVIEAHSLFTAFDGLRILSRALKRKELSDCAHYRPHVTEYINDVVPRRNRLGHRVLDPEGRPVSIRTTDGETVSVEDMRALRCQLLELRSQFRELHGILLTHD